MADTGHTGTQAPQSMDSSGSVDLLVFVVLLRPILASGLRRVSPGNESRGATHRQSDESIGNPVPILKV